MIDGFWRAFLCALAIVIGLMLMYAGGIASSFFGGDSGGGLMAVGMVLLGFGGLLLWRGGASPARRSREGNDARPRHSPK